jgi:PAS domain S-box-containing protein
MAIEIAPHAPTAPARRSWGAGVPLRSYLVVLVLLFGTIGAAGTVLIGAQARHDALTSAREQAAFWARLAAKDVSTNVTQLRSAVAALATDPSIRRVFADPSLCALNLGPGLFAGGHLDVVRSDGSRVCSSRSNSEEIGTSGYASADWFARAQSGAVLVSPTPDPITAKPAAVLASPVPGLGVVVAFVDLGALGPSLSSAFGDPAGIEFVMTTGDGGAVLSRSIEPARWAGASIGGLPFARAQADTDRPDVDGVPRLYGMAAVSGVSWKVFAGADRSAALASAGHLYHSDLTILLIGMAALLVTASFVYGRITSPIHRLSTAVRAATTGAELGPIEVKGPGEIVGLSRDFSSLVSTMGHELAERQRAEETVRASERSYRLLFLGNPQPMWIYDPQTLAFLEVNDAAVAHYGYSRKEFRAMTIRDIGLSEFIPAVLESLATTEVVDRSGPWRHRTKAGGTIEVEITSHAVSFADRAARFAMAEDVTERRRLEHQLHQSQRLDSLGQLAGGVAHDFNNLLAVILNYASFVGEEVVEPAPAGDTARWDQVRNDVEQIRLAAERAARLTHQLLLFGRGEVAHPQTLSLNDVVVDVEQLLLRTIGEDIELVTSLGQDPWFVMADPGQVEQVLVNLVVNARDAMPSGGTLSIDTENITADADYAAHRAGMAPGRYVRLRVSDTGSGMTREIQDRVFEPFYSTKPRGQGTGLGLATVYGIVTQARGHIHVYSEPGLGSSFSVLLPVTERAAPAVETAPGPRAASGSETILVVEDEAAMLEVTSRILQRDGYRVIAAASGQEAIAIVERGDHDIRLMITDVVMPQMQGREVAERVAALRPDIRILYMSGYAQPLLASRGTLDAGIELIEKPFSADVLLTRVRGVLDATRA